MAVDNKAKYISVAVTTEGEQSRAIQGSPPNPVTAQKLYIAQASCAIVVFPTTATGNDAPAQNVAGNLTNLTGPAGDFFSQTYDVAIGKDGTMYALGSYFNVDEVTCQASINSFTANATGNVPPINTIGSGYPTRTTLSGNVLAGATSLPVTSITGFTNGGLVAVMLDGAPGNGWFFLTTVNGIPSGGNIPIADALPYLSSTGRLVMAVGNLLNYFAFCSSAVFGFGGGMGIDIDSSNNLYVGFGGFTRAGPDGVAAKSMIFKFAAGATGNATPTIIKEFDYTRSVSTIYYDATNNWIWFGGFYLNTLLGYVMAIDLAGNTQVDIEGSNTTLNQVSQVTLSPTREIVVSEFRQSTPPGPRIVVFAPGTNGNAVPTHSFGDDSLITSPTGYNGIALDNTGSCWIGTGIVVQEGMSNSPILKMPFPSDGGSVTPTTILTNEAITTTNTAYPMTVRVK